MKDRIAHIMKAKNLKASDFATLLGIQPSGVSHILAGRNKPSLEFVKKIKETFPEYNLDWIIFGTGPMTTSEPYKHALNESNQPTPLEKRQDGTIPFDFDPLPNDNTSLIEEHSPVEMPEPAVKSVLILYEDGSFETYTPKYQ